MATYEEIYGKRVKEFDSDPTLDSSYEGQVWYDKSSGTNKALVQIKAWSSSGALNTARRQLGGAGTSTTGLVFGGFAPPVTNATEEYNGFNWSTGGNLGTAKYGIGGTGTQTAALALGGSTASPPSLKSTDTEEYDGSSWTAGGAFSTSVRQTAAAGTQTAGIKFGGATVPGDTNSTEEYDGSSWTAGGNLGTAGYGAGSGGIQTAALRSGGNIHPSARTNITEEYNGSTWTAGNPLNTPGTLESQNYGTQTNSLAGGRKNTAITGATEEYDGTIWTTSPATMGTARYIFAGFGSRTSAVAAGGLGPPSPGFSNLTEEYNSNINAIVKSSWASGGNMSSVRAQHGSANAGTQDSGLAIGGYVFQTSTNTDSCEEYGGSSWTSGGDLPTTTRQKGASGTQTATIAFGGFPSPGPGTESLNYNGSSWTSAPALNTGAVYAFGNGGGTSTAALRAGSGNPGGYTTTTEEYDGSSWTSGGALNSGMTSGAVDGSLTAGIVCGGEGDPSSPLTTSGVTSQTEEYNGSSWATGNPIVLRISSQGKSGGTSAQTAWMIAGGDGPTVTNNTGTTQLYDGTNWSTSAPLSTPRRQVAGGGTQASGLVFGGTEASSTSLNSTEEFTNGSETVTARTLTTS